MRGLVVLVLVMGVVNQAEHELMPAVKGRQSILASLIEGIEWIIVVRKRGGSLSIVKSPGQRVVARDLESVRQAAIEPQNQRVVLREDVAANLSDLSVVKVRAGGRKSGSLIGAEENRHADNLSIRGSTHRRHVHKLKIRASGSRQISVDEVRKILSVAEQVRSRDHGVAGNLPLEDRIQLMDSRQLEARGKILHRAWY